MARYALLISLLIISACQHDNEPIDNEDIIYSPIIIIQFRETGISPALPRDISSNRDNVSACVLIPDTCSDSGDMRELVIDALENDMFVALLSDSCLNFDTEKDHIRIWADSTGSVRTHPEELQDSINFTKWLKHTDQQDILLGLLDMYKPDLTHIVLRIGDVSSVLHIAEFWTTPDILSRYTVVMFCLPEYCNGRGWCAFAGEQINGSTPHGLTAGGLFSTIRILAGLLWEDTLPSVIPAISILKNTDDIWSAR